MQEFIQQLTQKFGIGQSEGQSVTAGLLNMAKDHVATADFDQLLDKVPGAKEAMENAPVESAESESGGGLLGSITQMASSALGGKAGSALGLASILKGAGIDMSKAGELVTMFISFLKEKAGGDFVEKILGQLPDLKDLVGGGGE